MNKKILFIMLLCTNRFFFSSNNKSALPSDHFDSEIVMLHNESNQSDSNVEQSSVSTIIIGGNRRIELNPDLNIFIDYNSKGESRSCCEFIYDIINFCWTFKKDSLKDK